MNSPVPLEKLWEATLADAQLQMTRGTFDTWMKGTHALYLEDGALVVATPNAYAIEWLENRLRRTIETTLARHHHTGGVKFIVAGGAPPAASGETVLVEAAKDAEATRPPQPSKGVLELMEFDPTIRGWQQLPAYASQFWLPYLGHGPYLLWQTIRSFGQGEAWPSIVTLADILCGGNRQQIIGRTVRGIYRPGWLEVLETERIIWYKRKGQNYLFRVLDRLPLLTPQQVARLSKSRQRAHQKFLAKANVDMQEWQQLTLASLSNGVKGV